MQYHLIKKKKKSFTKYNIQGTQAVYVHQMLPCVSVKSVIFFAISLPKRNYHIAKGSHTNLCFSETTSTAGSYPVSDFSHQTTITGHRVYTKFLTRFSVK